MLDDVLTDKECDFVIELLTAESEELMRKMRHTDARQMREDVHEQLRTSDRLIERVRELKAKLLTA